MAGSENALKFVAFDRHTENCYFHCGGRSVCRSCRKLIEQDNRNKFKEDPPEMIFK